MSETPEPAIYQLKVVLLVVSPMTWRRLLICGNSTITDLHYILQITMGWSDDHLHRFRIHGKQYGIARMGGLSFSDDPDTVRLKDFRFCCRIQATSPKKQMVRITIVDSDCEHIKKLNAEIDELGIKQIFLPLHRNPVILAADRAGCHSSCPVPTAQIKAAEVAMSLALPKDVKIHIRLET